MRFLSYAQNFEDVVLFRALKGVERGFYIDVGAHDPTNCTVTKAFYERGWHGINIEPVEEWFEKLVADRPNDINLRLAAWSRLDKVKFFEVPHTGLSTVDQDYARRHAADGFEVKESEIFAKPLDAICQEHSVKEIHFLKVDVEGAEAEVLRGINLVELRPWIILIEATEPNSPVTTHHNWEHLLTSRGYEFAYFDGLNRFYVAREHSRLTSSLSIPPNCFDEYILYREWETQQFLGRAEAERDELRRRLAEESRAAAELRSTLAELRSTLDDISKSFSMRITAPLRAVKRWFRLATRGAGSRTVPKHAGPDVVVALPADAPSESELHAILGTIRFRIVQELDVSVAGRGRNLNDPLELQLSHEGLQVTSRMYPVDALRRLPEARLLEALSLLLFKRPLKDMRALRAVWKLSHRRLLVLLLVSLLPNRRARMAGLYRFAARAALSKSPFVFALAKKAYYRFMYSRFV